MLNLNYLSRVFVLTTDMCKQWRRNYEHTTALLLFFRSYRMNAVLWYTFPASHRCIHHHVSGLLILFHFQVFSLRDKEEMEKKAEFWSLMFFAVGVTSFFSNLISVKRSSFSLSLIQPLFSTSFSECDFSENTNTVSWIIWQISLFRARCFPSLENLWLYDWERWLLKRFLNRSVNRTNKGQVHLDYTWNIFFPSSFSWSTVSFLVYAPYFLLKGFSSKACAYSRVPKICRVLNGVERLQELLSVSSSPALLLFNRKYRTLMIRCTVLGHWPQHWGHMPRLFKG